MSDSLRDVAPDERLMCLLVHYMRFKARGRAGDPVRTDGVEKAIAAIRQGIADLGEPDPGLSARDFTRLHPSLKALFEGLRRDDSPPERAHPANLTIIENMYEVLDTAHQTEGQANRHVIDLGKARPSLDARSHTRPDWGCRQSSDPLSLRASIFRAKYLQWWVQAVGTT